MRGLLRSICFHGASSLESSMCGKMGQEKEGKTALVYYCSGQEKRQGVRKEAARPPYILTN